jgi:hypothetical protein
MRPPADAPARRCVCRAVSLAVWAVDGDEAGDRPYQG